MIPKHRLFKLKMNKSLKIRCPLKGDMVVEEVLTTGNLSHNDNYIFLEVVANNIDEAKAIFRDNKKEIVQYMWDNTPVNTPEDVVDFINEAAAMEVEKWQTKF